MTKNTPPLKMTAKKKTIEDEDMEQPEEMKKFKTREKYNQEIQKLRSAKTQTQGQEGPTKEKGLSALE